MSQLKTIKYAKFALIIINFLAIIYNASIYLFSTPYIISQELSHSLIEKLTALPMPPQVIFFGSLILYVCLILVIYLQDHVQMHQHPVYNWFSITEVLLVVAIFVVLQASYNGLVLLVFIDIFYRSRDFYSKKGKRYWFSFIALSFGLLLISNYDLLSLFMKIPSLDTYIDFYPRSLKIVILFIKNFLSSLNIIVFILSLISFIMYSMTERHNIEQELQMVSKVNTELNNYVAVTEKIVEDRERKRIAREIHDTLGHALTGISAGIDAVTVLMNIDPERAKSQLKNMSEVVREGIVDVRRSLNKLRPGALEDRTLKDALNKMIQEYQDLSQIEIELLYGWEGIDLDSTKENIIFRILQESITNSLRHGHAKHMQIELLNNQDYQLIVQDDGVGCSDIQYGYGLTQMQERLAIIGGHAQFSSEDGFRTEIHIPKGKGEMYD